MRSRQLALAAAILGLVAAGAVAQQQPGQMRGRGPMMGGGMMGQGPMMGGGMMMGGGPAQFVEGRIAFLRAELGITSDQEGAWDAYEAALRQSAQQMQAWHDQMNDGAAMPDSLPERLAMMETMMASRLESLRIVSEATGPLYDALTDDQKAIADSLMGMM